MKPKIFLGSSKESLPLIKGIQASLANVASLKRWDEGVFRPGDYVLDRLIQIVNSYDFAIFAIAPEDFAEIRGKKVLVARDNVLFEAGLFFSQLDRTRTLLIVPKKNKADELEFHLPSDLEGLTNIEYSAPNLPGELPDNFGAKCVEIETVVQREGSRQAEESAIYDTRKGFDSSAFVGWGNYKSWDKNNQPTSPKGEGKLYFEAAGVLHVKRENQGGRFEVHLRQNGLDRPTIPKQELPARKLQVCCEAKAESGSAHSLRFVFKDEVAQKLNDQWVQVIGNKGGDTWDKIDLHFQVSSTVDWNFRIDDEVTSEVPGSVKIRNLVIQERP